MRTRKWLSHSLMMRFSALMWFTSWLLTTRALEICFRAQNSLSLFTTDTAPKAPFPRGAICIKHKLSATCNLCLWLAKTAQEYVPSQRTISELVALYYVSMLVCATGWYAKNKQQTSNFGKLWTQLWTRAYDLEVGKFDVLSGRAHEAVDGAGLVCEVLGKGSHRLFEVFFAHL